jgi:hypothetical protein
MYVKSFLELKKCFKFTSAYMIYLAEAVIVTDWRHLYSDEYDKSTFLYLW